MSITRRYVIFDELEKEETMALLDEIKIKGCFIQYVKLNQTQTFEQEDENVSGKLDA